MKKLLFLFFLLLPLVCKASDIQQAKKIFNDANALLSTDPDKAAVMFKKMYEIGIKEDNDEVCAYALDRYAYCMFESGDAEISISLYYNALSYCPPRNVALMADIKNGLGMAYGHINNIKKAETYFFEAVYHSQSIHDNKNLRVIYSNLANLYASAHDYSRAEYYFLKALVIDGKDVRALKKKMASFSNGKENSGELRFKYLQHILSDNIDKNDFHNKSVIYSNMAESYYYQKKFLDALQCLEKSDEYATNYNLKSILAFNLELRAKIYAGQKDYPSAYMCMKQMKEISDKLNNEKNIQEIEHKITSRQLLKLKAENEKQKQANTINSDRLIFLFIGVAVVAIALFAFFRFITYKKHKQAQLIRQQYELEKAQNKVMELEVAHKEEMLVEVNTELKTTKEKLDYLQLFLDSRNELLEKIRQKIRENYKLDGNEHVTHLKNINNYIAQFQTKKDAKSPSQQEQQTDEFVKRLKEQFPAVTDGECKLATYIRLGLSAKEISLLTGTQINSIETYRHRLRKDLNLSPEQDLFEFLQTVC